MSIRRSRREWLVWVRYVRRYEGHLATPGMVRAFDRMMLNYRRRKP